MNRRSRFARRIPTLRAARHRRERHAGSARDPDASAADLGDACDPEDWGATAMELGLVVEPAPKTGEPARL